MRLAITGRLHGTGSILAPIISSVTQQEKNSWPLHIKHVGRLSWSRAEEFLAPKQQFSEVFNLARHRLFDISLYQDAIMKTKTDLIAHVVDKRIVDNLPTLLQEGLVSPIHKDDVVLTCNMTTSTEESKRRHRMINEPKLNALSREMEQQNLPKLGLTDMTMIKQPIATTPGARVIDLPWFYGQFPVPLESRTMFAFRIEATWYCLNVIPTGTIDCPALAHALTMALAEEAAKDLPVTPHAYIDDVRFSGSEEATEMAVKNFYDLCNYIGITMPEGRPIFQSRYTFLGVECRHDDGTVALSQKTLNKLAALKLAMANPLIAESLTLRQVMAITGILMWSAQVLEGLPTYQWYYLLKFLRRRNQAGWPLDEGAKPWKDAITAIQKAIDQCLNQPPQMIRTREIINNSRTCKHSQ